jgi:outer membrane receptor protein involved in Fe transport
MQQFYTAGFVQDTIRLTPTLTAELGLRYDHSNPWTERHNQLS